MSHIHCMNLRPLLLRLAAGFSLDTDAWLRDFEEAKELAQDTTQIIQASIALVSLPDSSARSRCESCCLLGTPFRPPQERNLNHPEGGPEASRLTASARRKLGTLGTQVEKLSQWLDSSEASDLCVTLSSDVLDQGCVVVSISLPFYWFYNCRIYPVQIAGHHVFSYPF